MNQYDQEKTVYLIDGSSFLYRAYYGVRPMHTTHGVPVQAVYSFCRMIKKLIKTFDPKLIAVVWDSPGKTTRHDIYPAYKATRQEAPSDLFDQKADIKIFCDLIGLPQIAQQGIEADDLMYSMAKDFEKKQYTTIFITSDKDMGQAISQHILMFDPFKDTVYTVNSFEEKIGFEISKLPFYYALLGDASDNIPGVRGIGKKGALELVTQFSSLEDMYEHLDQISTPRQQKAVTEYKSNALLSYHLFLLQYHPVDVTEEQLIFDKNNWHNGYPLFERLEFKSLLKELEKNGVTKTKEPLSQLKGYQFITISMRSQLEWLANEITKANYFSIDTELTGLSPLQNRVVGISICYQTGIAYYIPFGHQTDEQQLDQQAVVDTLKPVFENQNIKKIMHHAKFDMLSLYQLGIETQGLFFDTLIAAHLVTEDWQRINLKYLSEFYLNEQMFTFTEIVNNNGYDNFGQLPLALATEYAASDAHQTWQLYPILHQQLINKEMEHLFDTIELPLVTVLYQMEKAGIYCDLSVLESLDTYVSQELRTITDKTTGMLGEQFQDVNLNSTKQLNILLFEYLKLPPQKKTPGKTVYSTDQEVLEKLAEIHPIPGLILQYRSLFKIKTTYIDALPEYINPHTNRIHSTFSQTIVPSGRLASSYPNLQNIPTEPLHNAIGIRSAFKPRPGYQFISADYSQIELRVLAHLSHDGPLSDAFTQHQDIHQQTAAKLFDVPDADVTHEQRQLGKRINFSILYGLTPYGLSQDLRIPFTDAKNYIEKYFAQFPGVRTWMDQVIDEAKQNGYVTTVFGRRRYIPAMYEKNKNLYEAAKRIAINTVAQGTAAEITKKGMLDVVRTCHQERLDAQLLLQIHDELLISVADHHVPEAQHILKSVLESVVNWSIPLAVTIRVGHTWQEITK